MNNDIHAKMKKAFQEANTFLLISHIRPDGDAIGSILGLGNSLIKTGKKVEMVLSDGLPEKFSFLPGSDLIRTKPKEKNNLVVVLDAGDIPRTGKVLNDVQPNINIDHHITNQRFADLNIVDPESAATCAILAEFMPEWGLPIDSDVASCLLTGIIIDTIGFRTSNVCPKTLRLAAELMEKGAKLPELYHLGLMQRSFEAAQYWGAGLQKMEISDKILWTSLTLEDRKRSAYPGNDDADLVNMLGTIENIDVVLIFIEQKHDRVKVSWRSNNGMDVSKIALNFSGGGHPAAAGADITGTMDEVMSRVLDATKETLKQYKLLSI